MILTNSRPFIRRVIRFLALPYLYLKIDWNICKATKLRVVYDFFYIFFKLKYYPDNYVDCRFWEKTRDEWIYYYGSAFNAYPKYKLNKEVQSPSHRVIFNDKFVCSQYYKDSVKIPRTYGIIYPKNNYHDEIVNIFNKFKVKKIIIKPIDGNKGENIVLAKKIKDKIILNSDLKKTSLKDLQITSPCIIQEYICQHDSLSAFFQNSLNTIRVVTMYTKSNKIKILSSLIKFGRGNSIVDNFHQGGVCVGINIKNGTLFKYGFLKDEINFNPTFHPDTEKKFDKFEIPYWDEVIKMAEKVQSLSPFYRLLGIDIAITNYGPVLIEVNAHRCLAGQEAIAGPLLKNYETLKAFNEYNILYNKEQKKLLKR